MGAMRWVMVAAVMVSGCGVVKNHQPIPPGTPTDMVHVGPVKGGFRSVTFQVHDGDQCHHGAFWRGHVIGSYLGSDVDVDVPAGEKLVFFLGDLENKYVTAPRPGMAIVRCGGYFLFSPQAGAHYAMNLLHPDRQCEIVFIRDDGGRHEPVSIEKAPPCAE